MKELFELKKRKIFEKLIYQSFEDDNYRFNKNRLPLHISQRQLVKLNLSFHTLWSLMNTFNKMSTTPKIIIGEIESELLIHSQILIGNEIILKIQKFIDEINQFNPDEVRTFLKRVLPVPKDKIIIEPYNYQMDLLELKRISKHNYLLYDIKQKDNNCSEFQLIVTINKLEE